MAQYVKKFLGWLKKFGLAQNILGPVKGQGMSPKVWYFDEKVLHWASVVRDLATCIPRRINLARVND